MRTKEEFNDFLGRWRSPISGREHSEDDWEYFIPKIKMFELARRLKSPTSYITDYHTIKKENVTSSSTVKLSEDFYDFCRNMELRKKIKTLKKKIDENDDRV